MPKNNQTNFKFVVTQELEPWEAYASQENADSEKALSAAAAKDYHEWLIANFDKFGGNYGG